LDKINFDSSTTTLWKMCGRSSKLRLKTAQSYFILSTLIYVVTANISASSSQRLDLDPRLNCTSSSGLIAIKGQFYLPSFYYGGNNRHVSSTITRSGAMQRRNITFSRPPPNRLIEFNATDGQGEVCGSTSVFKNATMDDYVKHYFVFGHLWKNDAGNCANGMIKRFVQSIRETIALKLLILDTKMCHPETIKLEAQDIGSAMVSVLFTCGVLPEAIFDESVCVLSLLQPFEDDDSQNQDSLLRKFHTSPFVMIVIPVVSIVIALTCGLYWKQRICNRRAENRFEVVDQGYEL